MENEKKQKSKLGEFLRDVIIALVLAAVILLLFKPVIVKQHSMEPNFYGGDYLIVSRQAYSIFGDPATGDVIVFKTELTDEEGNNKSLIKRIIGCPGDTVEIRAGYVYLNGELLDEPYLMDQGLSGEMDQVTYLRACTSAAATTGRCPTTPEEAKSGWWQRKTSSARWSSGSTPSTGSAHSRHDYQVT